MKKIIYFVVLFFVVWRIIHFMYDVDCSLDVKFILEQSSSFDMPIASSITYAIIDVFELVYLFNLIVQILILIVIVKLKGRRTGWKEKMINRGLNKYYVFVAVLGVLEAIVYAYAYAYVINTDISIDLKVIVLSIVHQLGVLTIIDVFFLLGLLVLLKKQLGILIDVISQESERKDDQITIMI